MHIIVPTLINTETHWTASAIVSSTSQTFNSSLILAGCVIDASVRGHLRIDASSWWGLFESETSAPNRSSSSHPIHLLWLNIEMRQMDQTLDFQRTNGFLRSFLVCLISSVTGDNVQLISTPRWKHVARCSRFQARAFTKVSKTIFTKSRDYKIQYIPRDIISFHPLWWNNISRLAQERLFSHK